MRITAFVFVLAAFAVCALSMSADAGLLVFNYTAEEDGGMGVLTGTFSYDTSSADSNASTIIGEYVGTWTGSVAGGTQAGAAFSFSEVPAFAVQDLDPATASPDDMFFFGPTASTFAHLVTTGDIYPDDSLPTSYDLADYASAEMFLINSDVGLIGGSQTKYNIISITPEPSFAVLSLVGLAYVCAIRRRKRKAAG